MSTILACGHIRPIHSHGQRLYLRVRCLSPTVHDGMVWDAQERILYATEEQTTREAVYAELERELQSE